MFWFRIMPIFYCLQVSVNEKCLRFCAQAFYEPCLWMIWIGIVVLVLGQIFSSSVADNSNFYYSAMFFWIQCPFYFYYYCETDWALFTPNNARLLRIAVLISIIIYNKCIELRMGLNAILHIVYCMEFLMVKIYELREFSH